MNPLHTLPDDLKTAEIKKFEQILKDHEDDFRKAIVENDERAQHRTMILSLALHIKTLASFINNPRLAALKATSAELADSALEMINGPAKKVKITLLIEVDDEEALRRTMLEKPPLRVKLTVPEKNETIGWGILIDVLPVRPARPPEE